MVSYQKGVTCNPVTPSLDVERNVSNMGEVSNGKGKLSKERGVPRRQQLEMAEAAP